MAFIKLKAIMFGMTAVSGRMIHTDPKGSDVRARFPIVEKEEERERLVRDGMVDGKFRQKAASFDDYDDDELDGTVNADEEEIGEAGARKTKELAGADEGDAGATALSTAGSVAFQGGPLPEGTQGTDGLDPADPDAAPAKAPAPAPAPKPAPKPAGNGTKAKG